MQIVTLTSDFGFHDHYVAALKGAIFKEIHDVFIIDISHSIKAFNTANAAFQLNACFESFPKNTIHIIAVDSEPDLSLKTASLPAVMKYKDQFFVGNNNGFFGSFLEDQEPEFFLEYKDEIIKEEHYKFPSKTCFVHLAKMISKNEKISDILQPANHIKKAFSPKPIIDGNKLLGNVIHIDAFGNLITNISQKEFYTFQENTPFTIYYANRSYFIDKISNSYNEVVAGEKVAIFNSNGLLEIAINKGVNDINAGASKLFGMKVGDTITIEFNPPGSVHDINSLF